jgi:DNA-binding MarR family transcriptional regulator|uniref:Replication initiator A family protein n=1 Tax=Myoviridae sp. ctqfO1 TaxID=2827710 RepID=A0A8S5T3I7_9CAUD|nr:MAG TPA: Replication initiator A family protein [Myoviridae sp. ctqfO1]
MNNKKIVDYDTGETVVFLTKKLYDTLNEHKLSKSEHKIFFVMLNYIKGYSYEISLSVPKLAESADVNRWDIYEYLKNIESAGLIKMLRKENNRIKIFVNPYMVSKGKKIFSDTLELFENNEVDQDSSYMRKEKEENIRYDLEF